MQTHKLAEFVDLVWWKRGGKHVFLKSVILNGKLRRRQRGRQLLLDYLNSYY